MIQQDSNGNCPTEDVDQANGNEDVSVPTTGHQKQQDSSGAAGAPVSNQNADSSEKPDRLHQADSSSAWNLMNFFTATSPIASPQDTFQDNLFTGETSET